MISRISTPPPRIEKRPNTTDLLRDLLEGMVEDMEKNAEDEATRICAGIALRGTKMRRAVDVFNKYALARTKLSVEALVEVRNLLDKMLAEANALFEKYPIPDNAISENDKI